jgi:hypothetical protein
MPLNSRKRLGPSPEARFTITTLGKASAIEMIENWPLKICHLSCDECDQLSRILGNSVATAKAARKPEPDEDSDKPLQMANDRFSRTNFSILLKKRKCIPPGFGTYLARVCSGLWQFYTCTRT